MANKVFIRTFGWPMAALWGDYACPPKPVRAITSLLKGEGGEKIAEALVKFE
jgi:hypothetical protein